MAASSSNGAALNGSQKYRRITSQPENPFASFIPDQSLAIVPEFTLESGVVLYNVPVAYKTFGALSPQRDNAMVICHALTGSADVGDWWGPLLGGPGKAFDTSRFFVVCINSLGSPYGSASPVTAKDGDTAKGLYGPEFPLTTVRDDVNIFKLILDDLGVRQIAAVIGGSMGGMLVLEFAYFGKDYVRCIIPIATSARYSAWGISWGEAQRQSIYCDPKYDDGYYTFEDPPSTGLGAARMSALLTYRSRDSFESRFGRNTPDPSKRQNINGGQRPSTPSQEAWAIHNDGHKNARSPRPSRVTSSASIATSIPNAASAHSNLEFHNPSTSATIEKSNDALNESAKGNVSERAKKQTPTYFSAQSYLRYQGEKFIKRFDANCYIAITRKLDTHDVSRHRYPEGCTPHDTHPVTALHHALSLVSQPTLILGIQSDGLFTFAEQQELAAHIPNAALKTIDSPEGHDAFLLEFEQVNTHLVKFLNETLPDIMSRSPQLEGVIGESDDGAMGAKKTSTFGEAEVDDITAW
ncbi:homoserine O-acetyltransferase [Mytilinidion resinicola]|uniref:Homoserine O-acetyltransferase n=1 Tax=Mytilinidion resinicola TaxID=574789 RepID=A0A6A6Y3U4_9PEZI|nr:homoserine O-acetyltransferase [Mytilinidion resinicola]KAF2803506.1 homoserine O-acetyltransferase [Mytilinidion resinicola]